MRNTPLTIAFLTAGLLAVLSIIMGRFNGFIIFGIVFYSIVFALLIEYQNRWHDEHEESKRLEQARKHKFDYCWERVNDILKRQMNTLGLDWNHGLNIKSQYREFYDGVQNRPFRSFHAKLKEKSNFVIIIYDINNDDIVEFNDRISVKQVHDHFHGFNPFKRGPTPGFNPEHSRYSRSRRGSRRRSRPSLTFNFDEGDDYETFEDQYGVDTATIDNVARDVSGKGGGR